jgi:hypothetical protein
VAGDTDAGLQRVGGDNCRKGVVQWVGDKGAGEMRARQEPERGGKSCAVLGVARPRPNSRPRAWDTKVRD